MERTNSEKIQIKVRALISVGMVLNNHNYSWQDLGKVVEEIREVEAVVGKTKRIYDDNIKDPALLAKTLVNTTPIYFVRGMGGSDELNDQTLPLLRTELLKMNVMTRKEKQKQYQKTGNANYKAKHKDKLHDTRKKNYDQLREYGYKSVIARKMSHWSLDNIKNKLMEDGLI